MIHSILVEKLNKYKFIQFLFLFLPILLIVIYSYFYIIDVLNVTGAIAHNDEVVDENISDNLKEVVDYKQYNDNTYSVTINGSEEVEMEVTKGDPIYYVNVIDENWFRLSTDGSDHKTYSSECELIDTIKKRGSNLVYTIKGSDKEYTIAPDSLLATVSVAEDGGFLIEYSNSDITPEVTDQLKTLDIELETDNGYRLVFHDGYDLELKDMEVNFATVLPTDNIYYDEDSKTFIKNISSDFAMNFIFGSKIFTILISTLFYLLLLILVWTKKELNLLNKWVLICNAFGVVFLVLCILFTFVLFK